MSKKRSLHKFHEPASISAASSMVCLGSATALFTGNADCFQVFSGNSATAFNNHFTLQSYFFCRRLAARRSTSLAHVDALPSAAESITAFSASVNRIAIRTLLRSSGGFIGAPIFFFIPALLFYKIFSSTPCTDY